jgi:hypothetical protein
MESNGHGPIWGTTLEFVWGAEESHYGISQDSPKNFMLLVFRGLWNDGTSALMYREIMLRHKSIFQISTIICLSSISICNLLIDLDQHLISVPPDFPGPS